MPNFKTHVTVGVCVGAAVALSQECRKKALHAAYQPNLLKVLTAGVVGGVAACAADVLEPALHPNHRRFFHSLSFICLAVYLWKSNGPRLSESDRNIADVAGASYLSHLALDFCTPKCLPLI